MDNKKTDMENSGQMYIGGGKVMTQKKLYRSNNNRMICGVCGGIGEYFNVDATLIRLGLVLLGCTGAGIVAYFVAAIIIPDGER